jgi:hypothetical protein
MVHSCDRCFSASNPKQCIRALMCHSSSSHKPNEEMTQTRRLNPRSKCWRSLARLRHGACRNGRLRPSLSLHARFDGGFGVDGLERLGGFGPDSHVRWPGSRDGNHGLATTLIFPDQRIEHVGQGKYHMEIRHRQECLLLLLQPLACGLSLTQRAMSIPAGHQNEVFLLRCDEV